MLMINLNENNVASITTNYVNNFSLKKTMSIISSEKKNVNNYIYFLIPNLTLLLLLLFNQPTLCL